MNLRRAISIGIAVIGIGIAVWVVARDEAAAEALQQIAVITLIWVMLLQILNFTTDSLRYWMVIPDRFRPSVPPALRQYPRRPDRDDRVARCCPGSSP